MMGHVLLLCNNSLHKTSMMFTPNLSYSLLSQCDVIWTYYLYSVLLNMLYSAKHTQLIKTR